MNAVVSLALLSVLAADPDLSGFQGLPADPPPAEITRGAHYWIGNEDRLDVFYDDVKDKGGVHVGVGAEQNWIFVGWAKPQVAVMMDFDQSIVDLQRVYFVAFEKAATKEEFKRLWLDKSRKELRAGVLAKYPGKENAAARVGALNALDVARWSIERRFEKLDAFFKSKNLPWFLVDDAAYAACRDLVVGGRAFAVRGDLTANKTVQAIGAAATKAGLPVRSLYLSNAEQYFQYKKQVRANFLALPFDDTSVVLRTHGWATLGYLKGGNSYHYGVQSGPSFHAFLKDPLVWDARQILSWAPGAGEKGRSKLTSTDVAATKAAFDAAAGERKAAQLAKWKAQQKAQKETPSTPTPSSTPPSTSTTAAPAPSPAPAQ